MISCSAIVARVEFFLPGNDGRQHGHVYYAISHGLLMKIFVSKETIQRGEKRG